MRRPRYNRKNKVTPKAVAAVRLIVCSGWCSMRSLRQWGNGVATRIKSMRFIQRGRSRRSAGATAQMQLHHQVPVHQECADVVGVAAETAGKQVQQEHYRQSMCSDKETPATAESSDNSFHKPTGIRRTASKLRRSAAKAKCSRVRARNTARVKQLRVHTISLNS